MEFAALSQQCAPAVHHTTMAAVARVESSNNPFAIGVVGAQLVRQPTNLDEAVATAKALEQAGYNFSLGVGQVNRYNLAKYGLNYETAFNSCANLRAGSLILKECYDRARRKFKDEQQALQASFSCYYSGNFTTGFKPDFKGQPSYVQKVLNSAGAAHTGTLIPLLAKQAPKPKTEAAQEQGTTAPARNPQVFSDADQGVMVYQ